MKANVPKIIPLRNTNLQNDVENTDLSSSVYKSRSGTILSEEFGRSSRSVSTLSTTKNSSSKGSNENLMNLASTSGVGGESSDNPRSILKSPNIGKPLFRIHQKKRNQFGFDRPFPNIETKKDPNSVNDSKQTNTILSPRKRKGETQNQSHVYAS